MNSPFLTSMDSDTTSGDLRRSEEFPEIFKSKRHPGLYFNELTVKGNNDTIQVLPTFTSMVNPMGLRNLFKKKQKLPDKVILNEFTGLVKNGEMLLVLGRPGAGCTSLLKTLSGTDLKSFKSTSGEIGYDGIEQKEFLKYFKSDLIYNPELDVHFPHLTVKQTLDFALGCNVPKDSKKDEYVNSSRDVLTKSLGIDHTLSTKVGDDYTRGISGGERKRVSLAEALANRGSIFFWDNATRGLDSSTALEFIEILKGYSTNLQKTNVVTIYQAGENIYKQFDKVTVLYQGKQVYFGPIGEARNYFYEMGYEPKPRQDTAEFLTAITDPNERSARKGFEGRVPYTPEEFETYWLNSDAFKRLVNEIDLHKKQNPYEKTKEEFLNSKLEERGLKNNLTSHFKVPFVDQLELCTRRAFQNMVMDRGQLVSQLAASLFQALLVGSLFYKTSAGTDGLFPRGGVILGLILFIVMMSMGEIIENFNKRPILRKQHNYSMYHLSAEALSFQIKRFPVDLVSTLVLIIPIFFMVQLKQTAANFFILFLFTVLLSMTYSCLFQLISNSCKVMDSANAIGGFVFFISFFYCGYMLRTQDMHPWFKWVTYLNPMFFTFESVLSYEFHDVMYECNPSSIAPSGPSYTNLANGTYGCAYKGASFGSPFVDGDIYSHLSYGYRFSHLWRNLGVLIVFLVGFTILNCLIVEYLDPIEITSDKLLFLKEDIPKVSYKDDEEASQSVSSFTKEEMIVEDSSQNQIFDELKSKDLFAWKDINYDITVKGEKRRLLDQVNGFCVPGTLTALMGESGAGKTTLLNALAQRLDIGVISGSMLVNGAPLSTSFFKRTGFVQQQDVHLSQLTVRESLIFAARMRRPASVSDREKVEYVDKIISVLNMGDYRNAIVGKPGNGINVEQRKKLSIGVELVSKPSLLLFLDEPTSGLDSQSSWAIVKLLRDLSAAGQSILCTIHQPSATLFQQFDRLLLLKKGGQTVYFDDIGENSEQVINYFESNGARKILEDENPAEYILDVIGAGATKVVNEDWFKIWSSSEQKASSDRRLDELIKQYSKENEGLEEDKELHKTFSASYWTQFYYYFGRSYKNFNRDVPYLIGKFMMFVPGGLLNGFSYWNLGSRLVDTQNGLLSGFLMVISAVPGFNMVQTKAIEPKQLFETRELRSKTYRFSILLLAQFLNELITLIVICGLVVLCVVLPTKVPIHSEQFGMLFVTYSFFSNLFNISFGLIFIFLSPNFQTATVNTSLFVAIMFQASGVIQVSSLTPGIWRFVIRLNPFTYMIQNIATGMLHNKKVICSAEELLVFNPPSGTTCGQYMGEFLSYSPGYLVDSKATSMCKYCALSVADQFLGTRGIKYSHRWRNLGFFCAYTVFNLSFLLLVYGQLIPYIKRLHSKRSSK